MTKRMKLINMIENDMQSIHGNNRICSMHKGVVNEINATIVQNDVIMGQFIKRKLVLNVIMLSCN